MKTNRYFASNFLALALGVLVAGRAAPAAAQTETPLGSTVVRLSGAARASLDGKKWKPVKLGDILTPGTWLQTAKTADLDVVLGEQLKVAVNEPLFNPETRPAHFVSLSADTVLKLDKVMSKSPVASGAEPTMEISLELRQGTVTGNVKKLAGASVYEVAFPGGVAGMRETIYKASAPGQFAVLKGMAFVALTDGQTVKEVAAGNEFNAGTGTVGVIPSAPAVKPVDTVPVPKVPRDSVVEPPERPLLPPPTGPRTAPRRPGT